MKNNTLKFLIISLSLLVIFIVYLSIVGIETDKFNNQIKTLKDNSIAYLLQLHPKFYRLDHIPTNTELILSVITFKIIAP